MWKTLRPRDIKKSRGISLIILLGILLCSCTIVKQFNIYSQDMEEGKRYLKNNDYERARHYFQGAKTQLNYYLPLVYLAYIDYKTDRIGDAIKWIEEAEKIMVADEHNLRLLGYKALILLKKDKTEGLKALKDYIDNYEHLYPLPTITDVLKMIESGDIDIARLEKLIVEQIDFYEDGIEELFNTGTGPFEGIYGIRGDL
ncbi:MAG: hypothetical protein N3D15_06895 [Syntrophorhabdaceae bacterium]|nr:hypothetical protein [Syntrophorhabdaceae bacterium]